MNFKQWLHEWEGNNPATGQNYNGPSMTSHGIRSKYVADDTPGKESEEIDENPNKAVAKFGFKKDDELLKLVSKTKKK